MRLYFASVLIAVSLVVSAQDDVMKELEEQVKTETNNEKVIATFKANKVVNAHSCETVKGKTLDFRITHRFGNIVEQASGTGGFHQFYGLDVATDIRFSLDYGITNRIQVGIGRSRQYENIDGTLKIKLFEQTVNNKVPLTLVWYSNAAYTPRRDIDSLYYKNNIIHRFSFTHQLIIARKFGSRLSLQLIPTLNHRNVIKQFINDSNGSTETNTLFFLGAAGRFKITHSWALVADYFHAFDKFRTGNTKMPYYAPLGIGVELETGGHVFTINLTNSSGIIENAFLPYSNESWSTGAFKFGFNISRVFAF